MRIKNFYCTPKKVGGSSIVREIAEKYGVKKADAFEFKPDYIYSGKTTTYNGTKFFLKVIASHNVVLISRNDKAEEEILGNWKFSEILSALSSKNKDVSINYEKIKEMLRNHELSVKFNKSTTKDHGTLWRYKE